MILTTAYNTRLQSPGAKYPVRVYNRWGFLGFLIIWRAHSPDRRFSASRFVEASRFGWGFTLALGIIKPFPIPRMPRLGWICRPRSTWRKLFFAAIVSPVRRVCSCWGVSWGTVKLCWGISCGTARLYWIVPWGTARLYWGVPWRTARLCWGVPWGTVRWPGGFGLRLVAQHSHVHLCVSTMGREGRKSGWRPWKRFGRIWFCTGRYAFWYILGSALKHSTIRHWSCNLIFLARFYRAACVDGLDRGRWRSALFIQQITCLVRHRTSLILKSIIVCWPPPLGPADKLTGSAPSVWHSTVPC